MKGSILRTTVPAEGVITTGTDIQVDRMRMAMAITGKDLNRCF